MYADTSIARFTILTGKGVTMTTLQTTGKGQAESFGMPAETSSGKDRRQHRRHDMEQAGIPVDRWDGSRRASKSFGQIVDLSAGGVRIRTQAKDVRADAQIRLRLELPEYAGISPFIAQNNSSLEPTREWIGWMTVARVAKAEDGNVEVCGRLVDMDEMDRGMLSLYLSTQPLAA
jgi:hypothetical protein